MAESTTATSTRVNLSSPVGRTGQTGSSGDQKALALAFCAGDRKAFGQVVRLYQDRIYNAVLRMVASPDDAADIVQEAFMKAFAAAGTFQAHAQLYTWLFRIAMNQALSHRRSAGRRKTVSLAWETSSNDEAHAPLQLADTRPGSDPVDAAHQHQEHERLYAALAQLDGDTRAMIVMRDIEGCEYDQIAEILNIPLGTVKSRLFRARQALRVALESPS